MKVKIYFQDCESLVFCQSEASFNNLISELSSTGVRYEVIHEA